MTPPQVWCAIPVYNNAATVKDIATRARAQLDHVLIIDDGSTDADLEQLFAATRGGEALAEPGMSNELRSRREGEAPAEPGLSNELRLGGSLAPPVKNHPPPPPH